MKIPGYITSILETLNDAGHEAYIVGGCVRDAMLKRTPSDWDVTTSAKPQEVQRLFRRTLPTGIEHGTVTVLMGKQKAEVTTYRIDGVYEDARHPKEVTFTSSLTEDLRRRDFTVNAMAYHPEEGLRDPFNGMEDLRKGIIRAVGNAKERFTEDALRVMRAFRFAAQLSFSVEEETYAAAKELAPNLKNISAERIRDELQKLICSPHPETVRELYRAGITALILPEFDLCMETPQNNPHHCMNVGEHIIASMCAIRADRLLRWTMLLHDIAKPETRTTDEKGIDHFYTHPERGAEMARGLLRRMKLDNRTIKRATTLIRYHDMHLGNEAPVEVQIRKGMHAVGREDFPLLFEVVAADNAAKAPQLKEGKEKELRDLREAYERVIARGDAVQLSELQVSGADLIEAGIMDGPEIGEVLNAMLADVLKRPEHNDRAFLLNASQLKQYRNAAEGKKNHGGRG